VPSRPKEARRFSSDFKPPPPGAAGAGAGVVVGAPVPTLPPATRKRLGIPLRELELKKTLGTGTFGRVRLALHRKTNQVFALKMLQKAQIAALKQQRNIMAERDILWRVDHPFIIKLYDTYKDRDRLYMLLELVQVRARA
jgi:serine/threonine protein kinase